MARWLGEGQAEGVFVAGRQGEHPDLPSTASRRSQGRVTSRVFPSPGPVEKSWVRGCWGDTRPSRLRWQAPGKPALIRPPWANDALGGPGGEA